MKKFISTIVLSFACVAAALAQNGNLTGVVFGEERPLRTKRSFVFDMSMSQSLT